MQLTLWPICASFLAQHSILLEHDRNVRDARTYVNKRVLIRRETIEYYSSDLA